MSAVSSILTFGSASQGLGHGDPDDRIIGTKTSGPPGIEAIIEFNGLYMNVREWVDTYVVDTISGIDDADVEDTRESNPTDDGETPFGSRLRGRTIVLSGYIETKTLWKLRDMQSALRRAFSDTSIERPMIFRTPHIDTDVMIFTKKSAKIEMPETQTTQNGFKRAFSVTTRASNPRFVTYREITPIPQVSGQNVLFTCVNEGDFKAQGRYRIYGPCNAPTQGGNAVTITNEDNDDVLTLKAKAGSIVCLAANRYIEIDIAARTMLEYDVQGNVVANAFDRLHENSDWLRITPGINNITINYSTPLSTPRAFIGFRHTYV